MLLKADTPRVTATEVTEQQLADLVVGNRAFALDLYRSVSDGVNVFLSPYSAAEALAMTLAGARGATADEMQAALRAALAEELLHEARNELYLRLSEPVGEPQEGEADPFTFHTVNSLWGQASYHFEQDYLELLAADYDAGMNVVDFASDPEGARNAVNDSVADETEGRIDDLIPQGLIDTLTRLVLVNAVYFKAGWLMPFDPEDTEDGPFTTKEGTVATVPMMSGSAQLPYAERSGYQAVRLPYAGPASMLVVLPDDFESFELTLEGLEDIREGLSLRQVTLDMPRFEFRSSFSMKQALQGLGMELAFEPPPAGADLSGITGARELFVDDVVHEAFVALDEMGTEAAAATAVVIGLTSAGPPPVSLSLDKPFLFLIEHDETGEVLFIGHLGDPSTS